MGRKRTKSFRPPFRHPDRIIHRRILDALAEATGPANLQGLHLGPVGQAEVLLARKAAKVRAATDLARLPRVPADQRQPGADGIAVAFCARQPHIQVIAAALLRAIDGTGQQVAGIGAACRYQNREPAIPEQVGAVRAMTLTDKGQARREGHVVKFPAVVLEQYERFKSVHARTAVAQQDVQVAIVVQVAEVPAHGSPAAIEAEFAVPLRKRAIAVVMKHAANTASFRCVSGLHRINHVFVIRPDELHDVQPAIVIVIAPETGTADDQLGQAGFHADFCKGAVPVVPVQLRAPEAAADEQIRATVVVVVSPG